MTIRRIETLLMTTSQPNHESNPPQPVSDPDHSRRRFLKQSSVASAALTMGVATESLAKNSSPNETISKAATTNIIDITL